jgi:hypothetical protein
MERMPQPSGELPAVELGSSFADLEVCADFFCGETFRDEAHHFPLARRERVKSCLLIATVRHRVPLIH